MNTARLSPDRIAEATAFVDPVFLDSPLVVSEALSNAVGARVACKVECVNPIRSFKGRGTSYFVHRMLERQRARDANDLGVDGVPRVGPGAPMVCASAGNFGQGLAWAARRQGLPLTVFCSTEANALKVASMQRLGAQVIRAGGDFDEAKEIARGHAADHTLRFVEDGREPEIAEGAGTMAEELTEALAARGEPMPDAMLVPLGNGALLAGVATWMRAHAPRARIVAVCAAGAPAMARSIASGSVETTPGVETIADGIAVREPVPEALEDLRGRVDEVLLVGDDAIRAAMRLVLDSMGLIVEPAGVVGIAAMLEHPARFGGSFVATPLCGGNVTAEQRTNWL